MLERVIDDDLVAGHPLVQFDVVSELVLERVIDDLLVAGHPLVQQVKTKNGKYVETTFGYITLHL